MSTTTSSPPSPRRAELLDACYAYLLEHGLTGLSLRPLAAATGTSPRVLLYLFGSKDALLRELLGRARHEQVASMRAVLDKAGKAGGETADEAGSNGYDTLVDQLWAFLSAHEQRPMVRLTYEAFLLSLGHTPGPWAGFAGEAAREWLDLLIRAQAPGTPAALAEARATRALALVRGLLLDLLACEEEERVAAAVQDPEREQGQGPKAGPTPPPPADTPPR
ncbi:TetR/AcrR family transcriptional regulator [Streptomyces sp. NPDC005538]|uniref:TetR/AcrR family transcriptional regulator n=1 Tax=unclassified Streptomyces TaxID=2593676 RepID=UPI0033A31377